MPAPTNPYRPYATRYATPNGPGDDRPTAYQIVQDCNAIGNLKGRTVLITGCNVGLGVETARAMYEAGARLFLTARDLAKVESVIQDIVAKAVNKGAPQPEALELHLDSLKSVRKAAEEFKQRSNGQLNILINNAGFMAAPYRKTEDGFESHMGVNHFGHFLLFQLLKPLLLQSAADSGVASRVVIVSSNGHRTSGIRFDDPGFKDGEAYNKWQAYGQSKTANIYMANSIERHYGAKGIRGLSLHPGIIWTGLARFLGEDDFKLLESDKIQDIMMSPEQGAATTVWAAVSPHFETENGGRYLANAGETGPWKGMEDRHGQGYASHAYDEDAAERWWNMSYEAVGMPLEV